MNVGELINKNLILLDVKAQSKEEVIEILADLLEKENRLNDKEQFIQDVLYRENEYTTGIGEAIAIPHGQSYGVKDTSVVFARMHEDVEWNSLDNRPVKIIFLLAVKKEDASTTHIKILSKIAMSLMEDEFKNQLFHIQNDEEVLKLLSTIE